MMGDDIAWSDEVETNLSDKVGGTLSFRDQPQTSSDTQSKNIRSWSRVSRSSLDSSLDQSSSCDGNAKKIVFDIISAHTINDPGKKKYVSYTILVKTTPGLDNCPAVIERRYTDFLQLYQSIRKNFPVAVEHVIFPKKAVLGNFTADIITERSTNFHSFLTYLNSHKELKCSRQFYDFLHYKEICKAQKMIKVGQIEDATPLLENALFLLQKFTVQYSLQIFWTICTLVACLNSSDNLVEAQKYAEQALNQTSVIDVQESPLYLPFLQLSIHIWWSLGKDKKDLEQRLADHRLKAIDHSIKSTNLLDVITRHQFPF